jgi:hypothetical protein
VKSAQFLMAEWDRIERERLLDQSDRRPVLVPRELCDGDREIWWGGSVWWLQVYPKQHSEHGPGWTARLIADGPSAYGHSFGASQRQAVRAVLREFLSHADADRLAEEFPDDQPVGQLAVHVHGLTVDGQVGADVLEYVATVVHDGAAVAEGRGSTAEMAKRQALLNAGIAKLTEEGQMSPFAVGGPVDRQLPSRGWHPDQAVVEEIREGS